MVSYYFFEIKKWCVRVNVYAGQYKKFEKNLKYYQKTPIFISDEYSKEGGI